MSRKTSFFSQFFSSGSFFFFVNSRRKKGFQPIESPYFCVGQQKPKNRLKRTSTKNRDFGTCIPDIYFSFLSHSPRALPLRLIITSIFDCLQWSSSFYRRYICINLLNHSKDCIHLLWLNIFVYLEGFVDFSLRKTNKRLKKCKVVSFPKQNVFRKIEFC